MLDGGCGPPFSPSIFGARDRALVASRVYIHFFDPKRKKEREREQASLITLPSAISQSHG